MKNYNNYNKILEKNMELKNRVFLLCTTSKKNTYYQTKKQTTT